jgi:flagellin
MLSVNTNPGALVALENLNNTATQLQQAQSEVSTGLAVASPEDNGAVWAIAQGERATESSLDAVKSSLQTGQSIIDVATSAGTTVSDLLSQMKETALSASDSSLDTNSRAALNTQFTALVGQINTAISNADFNGVNLLNGSLSNITSLANADGTSVITTLAQNFALAGTTTTQAGAGSIITVSSGATISTVTAATAMIATVQTSLTNVDDALATMGTSSKSLGGQLTFVGNLQDSLETGIGNLVNANLAKESATLTALQTKQQLGIQALSIANSSSSALLGLFR